MAGTQILGLSLSLQKCSEVPGSLPGDRTNLIRTSLVVKTVNLATVVLTVGEVLGYNGSEVNAQAKMSIRVIKSHLGRVDKNAR